MSDMDALSGSAERRTLERLRVAGQLAVARSELPQFVRDNATLKITEDVLTDRLIFQLKSAVLAEKLVEERQTVTLQVPASWWEHFKRDSWPGRHRPQWMRRRWPVRYAMMSQTVQFRRYRTYPGASIALPPDRFGSPVIVETYTPFGWGADD